MGTLRFAPHVRVEAVPGEAVYLVSERGVTALHGRSIAALAPLLDGSRDLERILADAAPAVSARECGRIVEQLRAAGLVHEADGPPGAGDAYWSLAGLGPGPAPDAAAFVALGSTDPAEVRHALLAAGVRAAGEPAAAPLTLVACDDYLDPGLGALDAAHRAAGRRWLPVKPVGTELWIGPFLGAPDGPCWSCLAERLRRGRRAEAHLVRRLGRSGPLPRPTAALPASRAAALHLAAVQAAGWLAGHRHPAQGELWTLDPLDPAGERHPVRRRPQCARCGDPGLVAERVRAPLSLAPAPPASPVASPVASPAPTPAPAPAPAPAPDDYAHLVSRVTGLVAEIRRDPRGPEFLNCFHARYRPAPGPPGLDGVRAGLRAAAHGKGVTAEQARASALYEALEHHSGYHQGDEPRQRARYRDLGPDAAVHPDEVQLYAARQFEERDHWNARHSAQHRVCDPFDEDAEIDWTPVWSLTGERHRLMPTALLYYDVPQPPGRRYCLATSHGAAAGRATADAVLRGFLELVERDAVALWWYNRTRQPGLSLDGEPGDGRESGDGGEPGDGGDRAWIDRLRCVHAELGREVWALDLTTDFGIPVVAALSRRVDRPSEDITLGFGAHFDRRTALRRALTELNQMLPPLAEIRVTGPGGRGAQGAGYDGMEYEGMDPEALRWFTTATVANQPYLTADPAAEAAPGGARFGLPAGSDPVERVAAVVELVRRQGMEMLVLDQTRPDVGLPVVKVFVPGLRPHWARFAPGRLFETPVSLRRLATPTRYEDLNPLPLFL